jgi:Immunity protein Imm1
VWDRPHENPDAPGPYQQVRVVTDTEAEVGVLNFTEESEDGELQSWHTLNPYPMPEPPALRFDAGSALKFPRDAVLPFRDLRAALDEFTRTGERPQAVQWQTARWGDF